MLKNRICPQTEEGLGHISWNWLLQFQPRPQDVGKPLVSQISVLGKCRYDVHTTSGM